MGLLYEHRFAVLIMCPKKVSEKSVKKNGLIWKVLGIAALPGLDYFLSEKLSGKKLALAVLEFDFFKFVPKKCPLKSF